MIEGCAKNAPDTMHTAALLKSISFVVLGVVEALRSVQDVVLKATAKGKGINSGGVGQPWMINA